MPKKSNKRNNKGNKNRKKTRKQKPIIMIGCSKKNKKSCKNNFFYPLGNKGCPNCGPNCHCGPNCKCPHPCPGSCYLNRRNKKQKQKGGYGCGSCGCPIGGLQTKDMNKFGGSCNNCGQIPVIKGGGIYKPSGPIPGPQIGSAWGINNLPGQNGISSDSNYLPYNTNYNNPQLQMSGNNSGYNTLNSMVGGYKYNNSPSTSVTTSFKTSSPTKKKSKKGTSVKGTSVRGGGLIPQELINLGSQFNHNIATAYDILNANNRSVSPLPYEHQLSPKFK